MPIRTQSDLPAKEILEQENIFVMDENRAMHQDIRPINIVILNLMPLKEDTELQILRSLSNTPLQYFDGLIITGAPVELMEYEEVDYWPEVCEIMEWSKKHVTSTLHLCWGAQAGLYYHYGIQKHILDEKMFGVFKHKVMNRKIPLVRGFDDYFYAPHSRHTEIRKENILAHDELTILAESEEAGVFLLMNQDGSQIFVMGHPEYDRMTLDTEYKRDKAKNLPIHIPANYYPNDDDSKRPLLQWRSHGNIMYANWLNYYVYQQTPYQFIDVAEIIGK